MVVQWLRICLPLQGTRVQSLVREDPTCCGATKPMRHNYWARALEPASHNYWACALEPGSHDYWSPCATTTETRVPQLLKPMHLESVLRNKRSLLKWEAGATRKSNPCSPQLEKAHMQQWRPNAGKKVQQQIGIRFLLFQHNPLYFCIPPFHLYID